MPRKLFCLNDARLAAKRRLPRMLFDFVDGAAGAESLKQKNESAIDAIRLQPRVLVNVEKRSLEKTFLGKRWGLPVGVAPMGMCNLTWPGADNMLANVCTKHNIPLGLSTAASSTIEDMAKQAGDKAWFQLYVGQSEELAFGLVDRAAQAGYEVLLLTVDVPQVAPRFRDLKNGFKTPFKIGPKQFVDFALHPQWSISTLLNGTPRTANYAADSGDKSFVRGESRGRTDWDFLKRLRDKWQGKLVVKGVLHADDAIRIRDADVDAVYVSNHGGRQLDSAPAAIEALLRIREAVGNDYPLLFDSGVRNGEAVVKALASGADFVMLGRPFMYGIGADGERGLEIVVGLLKAEISLALAQLGKTNIEDIDSSVIVKTKI
ncbi:MAG: alpha-hydroxy acid oxidase [Arenicellales bacterium WSBS_2016_MAG_OTU3]